MKDKILVYTTTFPKFTKGDSTPPFVFELSKRLCEKFDIYVLTPRVPGSKKYEEIEGLKIYRYSYFFSEKLEKLNDGAIMPNLKANKWLYIQVPFLLLFSLINLIKLIKKEGIQIIHAHWILPQGLLAVIYKNIFNKKIKIICTTHGGDIFGLKSKLGTALKKLTLQQIDELTVVSSSIKKECLKLGILENKVSTIPMGVDSKLFHPKAHDKGIKEKYGITGKMVLFAGRLAEKKGVSRLIDGFQGVAKFYPDTRLIIIGHGPLEEKLKKQVQDLGLQEFIIFLGAIPNNELPAYYATADIFIGPSIQTKDGDSEGFGLVFVEAILSGCITIGSNLHGIKDIIIDGETGYLLKTTSPNEIEEVLKRIISKSEINKEKAREVMISKFDWEIIKDKYSNLLLKNDIN